MRLAVRRIVGDSMQPGLQAGRVVLFWRGPVRPGDVVLLRHGGLEKIKRLAKAEDGKVYLLGDNPAASTDSRSFGWLDQSVLHGRLIWPRRPKQP